MAGFTMNNTHPQSLTSAGDFHNQRLRSRQLLGGIATAALGRGAAAIAPLFLIPITLSYLGKEVYGVWMAVTALTSMTLWADLGLGNGLMTKLTPRLALGDLVTARRYISTAYAAVASLTAGLLLALWTTSSFVPWASAIGVTDPRLTPLVTTVVLVCVTAFFVNVPLSLIQRVQYANRQVMQSNLWQLFGSVLSVVTAWVAVMMNAGSILVILSAVSGPLFANLINSLVVFGGEGRAIRPTARLIDARSISSMLRIGVAFFVLSVITSLATNADTVIVARVLGPSGAASYAIPARAMGMLGLLVTVINLPLWPANGEALTRGDAPWMLRTTRRITLLSALVVLLTGVLAVILGNPLLELWLGQPVGVSPWFLAGLSLWWFALATASPRFMVQNAAGVLRPQLIGWSTYLVLSLPMKWWAVTVFGLPGISIAAGGLYVLLIWPAAQLGYVKVLHNVVHAFPREGSAL